MVLVRPDVAAAGAIERWRRPRPRWVPRPWPCSRCVRLLAGRRSLHHGCRRDVWGAPGEGRSFRGGLCSRAPRVALQLPGLPHWRRGKMLTLTKGPQLGPTAHTRSAWPPSVCGPTARARAKLADSSQRFALTPVLHALARGFALRLSHRQPHERWLHRQLASRLRATRPRRPRVLRHLLAAW